MKKYINSIISILLSLVLFSVSSSAATAVEYSQYTALKTASNAGFNPALAKKAAALNTLTETVELRSYLFEKFSKCETSIDISGFKIASSDYEYLKSYIWYEMVEAFHVYSLGATAGSGIIKKLNVGYRVDSAEFKKYYNICCNVADSMTSDLNNSDLSSVEKALLVHDRLITHCEYSNAGSLCATMAGALAEQSAVCSGYARAYKFMMRKLNIPCSLCQSDELNHEWNILTINGQKYHVDTTWDDPTYDRFGQVHHDNFLRSTKGIISTGHDASDYDRSPTASAYDNYYWQNSETEFQYKNKKLYYFDTANKTLCTNSGDSSILLTITSQWRKNVTHYSKSYVCLDSDKNGNLLFFSTPDSIYTYNITTGKTALLYTPDKPENSFQIFGFTVYDEYFCIDQYNSPDIAERSKYSFKYKYKNSDEHTLTLNANGGAVSPESIKTTASKTITLPKPEKYFTITYNANEGSGAPAAQTVSLECLGWSQNQNSSSAEYSCGEAYTLYKNTTLYAVWGEYADAKLSSTAPTRTGYTFKGWSEDSRDSKVFAPGSSVNVYDSTTLYAVWQKNEPIKVNAPTITVSNVASSGKIKVSWSSVENAEKYRVYRSESKYGTYTMMKETTALSYTNTSAVAGKTYYYKVKSVAKDGNESGYSSVKSRTCGLARPNVTASNNSETGKVKLKWDKVKNAVSYKVYRSEQKDGVYKLMKTTTSTSYTNTSANAGKTYYYKVKAVAEKSAANSAESKIITRTCDLPKPTVKITLNSKNHPKLTWNTIDGAVSYKVYRSETEDGSYKLSRTTTNCYFTNTSVTGGKTYYYKVRAISSNSNAHSAYSDVLSIRTK